MQGRPRIETPEHAAFAQAELVALEERFRAGPGDPAASRDLARQIVRLRLELTSYALRHQVRDAHDQETLGQEPTLRAHVNWSRVEPTTRAGAPTAIE
jgi:hypothetical protein